MRISSLGGLALIAACSPPVQVRHEPAPPLATREEPAVEAKPERVGCGQRAAGRGEVVELAVPGFRAALLSLPLPKEQLQDEPWVLAAHGAGDNAQAQCEVWREVIGACGAILCISGTPIGPGDSNGYFFRNHLELEKEVLAAVAALQAQFTGHIATNSGVYVSYSQGGTMGALMLAAHGALFSRLVLVEGGTWDWTLRRAKEFAQTGGTRVLLVCGTPGCNRGAAQAVRTLTNSGLKVKHLDVPGGGHAYWGSVATAVAKDWPWVVEGDSHWQ